MPTAYPRRDSVHGLRADVRAAELRATGPLVTGLIERELNQEELSTRTFGELDAASVLLASPPAGRFSAA